MTEELDSRYWDRVPGDLGGESRYLDPFLAWLKRRENLGLVREWGGLRPDGRVLKTDVFEESMGEDAYLADLAGECAQAVGMDISASQAARADARFSASGAVFVAADVRRLPFADASFAVITSPSSLDHFPDTADLQVSLKELFRVLEPGGRLVITIDNRRNILWPLLRLAHALGFVPFYIGPGYTVDEFVRELEKAGFEVADTTAIVHNPRLMAVGSMRIVRWLRFKPLIRAMQRFWLRAQRLRYSRWRYRTGVFIAALALRPHDQADP
jgi:SAM-dependent methyltransferase